MQLPTPPTDSLYKFLCISSLVAGVALFIWTDKQITDFVRRGDELDLAIALTSAELDVLQAELESTIEGTGKEAAEPPRVFRKRVDVIRVKTAELRAKVEAFKRVREEVKRREHFRVVASWFLAAVFLAFAFMWQRRIQNPQDRLLQAQADAAERALAAGEPKKQGGPYRRRPWDLQ